MQPASFAGAKEAARASSRGGRRVRGHRWGRVAPLHGRRRPPQWPTRGARRAWALPKRQLGFLRQGKLRSRAPVGQGRTPPWPATATAVGHTRCCATERAARPSGVAGPGRDVTTSREKESAGGRKQEGGRRHFENRRPSPWAGLGRGGPRRRAEGRPRERRRVGVGSERAVFFIF
jgi:hypothetical protein